MEGQIDLWLCATNSQVATLRPRTLLKLMTCKTRWFRHLPRGYLGYSSRLGVMPSCNQKIFRTWESIWTLDASAKDVLQQARKTEKLLKKHGTFTELNIQEDWNRCHTYSSNFGILLICRCTITLLTTARFHLRSSWSEDCSAGFMC